MKKSNKIKVDLSKGIYRGLYTEIAKENQCSRQAVWNAIHIHQNPRILTILRDKIKARNVKYSIDKAKVDSVLKEIAELSEAV